MVESRKVGAPLTSLRGTWASARYGSQSGALCKEGMTRLEPTERALPGG